MTSVAIIHPGRPSHGERARVATWTRLATAMGSTVSHHPVLAGPFRPDVDAVAAAATGRIVPEAALWPVDQLMDRLTTLAPDVVVCQTARVVRPEVMAGPWTTVIDLVDQLSVSYRQRATIGRWPLRTVLRVLAERHRAVESALAAGRVPVVVAGRADAERLGVEWIPNLIDPIPAPGGHTVPGDEAPFDLVFFGSLAYPPNVDGLAWVGPALGSSGLGVLVAGHRPSRPVRSLCHRHRWTLVEDYPSVAWLASQAPVAIAPLRATAGIQNKVLDAAAAGMAQVVTPQALAGLEDGFPACTASTPAAVVGAVRGLLADPDRRDDLARRAVDHVARHYTVERWLAPVARLWRLAPPTDDHGGADRAAAR